MSVCGFRNHQIQHHIDCAAGLCLEFSAVHQESTGSSFKGNHIPLMRSEAGAKLQVVADGEGPRFHRIAEEVEGKRCLSQVHGQSLLEKVDVEERQSYPAGADHPFSGVHACLISPKNLRKPCGE